MKKNILLTGGAGYIGSHVVNLLIDKGFSVTVIDSLITGNKNLVNKKAKLIVSDIANIKKISQLLSSKKFDLVLHFAGLIRVDESVKKPQKYLKYNYSKSKIFLKMCHDNGIKKIIFSSTASVYGNLSKSKVNEGDITKPINPYATSKFLFEKYLMKISKTKNVKYIILRYFNVAGADKKLRSGLISKHATHLIKVACEVATNKRKKLIINGSNYNTPDGTTIRDFIHVRDLAEIHYKVSKLVLNKRVFFKLNCGYGYGFSVLEILKKFAKISKKKINYQFTERRKGDIVISIANPSKIKKIINWKPKHQSLNKLVKSSLDWYKKTSKINKHKDYLN